MPPPSKLVKPPARRSRPAAGRRACRGGPAPARTSPSVTRRQLLHAVIDGRETVEHRRAGGQRFFDPLGRIGVAVLPGVGVDRRGQQIGLALGLQVLEKRRARRECRAGPGCSRAALFAGLGPSAAARRPRRHAPVADRLLEIDLRARGPGRQGPPRGAAEVFDRVFCLGVVKGMGGSPELHSPSGRGQYDGYCLTTILRCRSLTFSPRPSPQV